MHNKHTGHLNILMHQIFEHLHNSCGNIENLHLQQNEDKMKQPWNQDQLIETVFHQIEEGIEYTQ